MIQASPWWCINTCMAVHRSGRARVAPHVGGRIQRRGSPSPPNHEFRDYRPSWNPGVERVGRASWTRTKNRKRVEVLSVGYNHKQRDAFCSRTNPLLKRGSRSTENHLRKTQGLQESAPGGTGRPLASRSSAAPPLRLDALGRSLVGHGLCYRFRRR